MFKFLKFPRSFLTLMTQIEAIKSLHQQFEAKKLRIRAKLEVKRLVVSQLYAKNVK